MGKIHWEHEATDSLRFQVDDLYDGTAVSLDAMWRAVGSPAGREPGVWAELARPLIDGMREYHRRVEAARGDGGLPEAYLQAQVDVWLNEFEVGDRAVDEFHRLGDVMSIEGIAEFYANYLDGMAARDAGCDGFPI